MALFTIKAFNNQISRRIDLFHREEKSLTGMQYGVLGFIAHNGAEKDIFQKDIEEEFNIRRSTATGILQLMEKNHLLRREPAVFDARLKKIVLTDKARALQLQAEHKLEQLEAEIRKGISEQEMNTFFSIIDRMMQNLRK